MKINECYDAPVNTERAIEPRKNLYFSFLDGLFFSIMVGLGESYFSAYALELGHSEIYAGLVGTIPLFVGGVLQLFSPWGVRLLGSYKRFVCLSALSQGLMFIPLIYSALVQKMSFTWLLIIISFYWVFAFSTGPSWNAWLNQLIPKQVRPKFFSKRNLYMYIGTFLGLIIAGLMLQWSTGKAQRFDTFAFIFTLCLFARMLSAYFLTRHSPTPQSKLSISPLSFATLRARISKEEIGKVILFALCFRFAVYLSAPFFVPYMLKKLQMSYFVFMLIISSSSIGKMFIMRFVSKMLNKFNLYKILHAASLGICFIPAAWLLSSNFYYLFFIEIFSGIFWGLLDYALFLLMFNGIPRSDQPSVLSLYNFLNVTSIIIGSLIGSILFKYSAAYISPYIFIFLLSTAARYLIFLLFPRTSEHLHFKNIKLVGRLLGLRPGGTSIETPVVASISPADQKNN